jgi:hypothetical protein
MCFVVNRFFRGVNTSVTLNRFLAQLELLNSVANLLDLTSRFESSDPRDAILLYLALHAMPTNSQSPTIPIPWQSCSSILPWPLLCSASTVDHPERRTPSQELHHPAASHPRSATVAIRRPMEHAGIANAESPEIHSDCQISTKSRRGRRCTQWTTTAVEKEDVLEELMEKLGILKRQRPLLRKALS